MKNCHGDLSKCLKNFVIYTVKHLLENNYLYSSLKLPYLSYTCEIWRNTYMSQLIVQKKKIRNIVKASYLDHTHPLLVQ